MMERRSSTPPTTTLTHKAVDKHWLFAKALTASQVVAIDKFHFFFSLSVSRGGQIVFTIRFVDF